MVVRLSPLSLPHHVCAATEIAISPSSDLGNHGGMAVSEAVEGVGSSLAMGGEVLERKWRLTEGVV